MWRNLIKSKHFTIFTENTCKFSAIAAAEAKCPFGNNNENIKWEDAKPFKSIPGPKPIPGIGIAHKYLPGGKYHNLSLTQVVTKMKNEFGDIVLFPSAIGQGPMLLLFDPDDVEKVYRNEGQWPIRMGMDSFAYFRKNKRPEIFHGVGGLLTEHGESWQKIRTKTNQIMLPPKTVHSYVGPIDDVAFEFVDRIKLIRDSNSEVPGDFLNEISKFALESVSFFAMNKKLGILKDLDANSDANKFIAVVRSFFDTMFELDIKPSLWRYIKTPTFHKMMGILDNMTDLTMKYIDEAIAKIEDEKKHGKLNQDRETSILEKLYNIDRHVAIIMALDMLMAGVDTTAGATANTLYILATNPDKQEILRNELFEKLPSKDSKLTPQLMNNMPYLKACLKESFRLKQINPGNLRTNGADLVLKGYQVPKGVNIIVANGVIQTQEKFYPRSQEFIPERWLRDGAGEYGIQSARETHPFVYLPFGFGPRTCIGKRFAEMEIETLVARTLRNFKIEWHHPEPKFGRKMFNMPSGDLKFRFIDLEK